MPIPTPKKGDSHDDFMSRCMGNNTMNKDYPDQAQRYAVCQGAWDKKKDDASAPDTSGLLERSHIVRKH